MKNSNKIQVLVSGSTGQLGQEFQHLAKKHKAKLQFTFKDRKGLDLSKVASIKNCLKTEYDFFVNTGAYTAVDKAETDEKRAYLVNSKALEHIAKHSSPKTKLIHISTDYVYHWNPQRPLLESDKTNPQSIYAKSKLAGEKKLLARRKDAIVLRTSWVYSSYGNNFVKTMLRLGKDRDNLNIVSDQLGTPTYARDLANAIIDIMINYDCQNYDAQPKSGIYNYSNLGLTNWSEFAKEIFKQSKIKCKVGETTTKAFNAPAPRPSWSMLSKEKIQSTFQLGIPQWEKSVGTCLRELGY